MKKWNSIRTLVLPISIILVIGGIYIYLPHTDKNATKKLFYKIIIKLLMLEVMIFGLEISLIGIRQNFKQLRPTEIQLLEV